MRCLTAVFVGTLLAVQPHAGLSQSSVEGSVSSDSAHRHSLPGVEISIPALKLTTQSNFAGDYRLPGIAPGRYLAIATAAGYRSVGDSITVTASGGNFHDFVLATKAILLDSVVSKAGRARHFISPMLNDFDDRRLAGKGGYFVTDSVLRHEEDRPLADIIRLHVPGTDIQALGSRAYVTSGRGPSTKALVGGNPRCYPDVYLDGVPLAKLPDPQVPAIVAVDLHQFVPGELSGVEYYPGGASLPVQFSQTSSGCGALLLWTREK